MAHSLKYRRLQPPLAIYWLLLEAMVVRSRPLFHYFVIYFQVYVAPELSHRMLSFLQYSRVIV